MGAPFEKVMASYHRARRTGEFFDTFYDLFLRKSPEIPPMFAHTDFTHQKRMLRESLLEMLVFFQIKTNRDEIERLGELHRARNIKSEHYELWLDALCESLAKHDPDFNAQLEKLWREAMRFGIQVMTADRDSVQNPVHR